MCVFSVLDNLVWRFPKELFIHFSCYLVKQSENIETVLYNNIDKLCKAKTNRLTNLVKIVAHKGKEYTKKYLLDK